MIIALGIVALLIIDILINLKILEVIKKSSGIHCNYNKRSYIKGVSISGDDNPEATFYFEGIEDLNKPTHIYDALRYEDFSVGAKTYCNTVFGSEVGGQKE